MRRIITHCKQFSLLTLFAVLAILLCLIASRADRAHKQRELVARVPHCIIYDFQEATTRTRHSSIREDSRSPYPRWIVTILGQDMLFKVIAVDLTLYEGTIDDEVITLICKQRSLKFIRVDHSQITHAQLLRLTHKLPDVTFLRAGSADDRVCDE